MKVNIASTAALIASLIILERETRNAPWDGLRGAGAVVGLVGITGVVIARFQLRRPLGDTSTPTRLVTTGLYARLRNPIYTFGMFVIAGVAMFIHKPWMMLGVVVLLPLQLQRIRREERELLEAFGDEYVRYRQKTWF
ncbi:Phospholipid methyltransferase [Bryocella elongata]|uniref:Phospholipid methyltransferase n=1 Tax=Bryocella elongata TaxID=863522 RepID=A0A1H6BJS1_9BACT|nr:isoprenylcysteine carboxylmethyltransferase family protein [Bryocella elongata]SEG60971.1 Phospholipid methyltransferase [Bryocella elongata]